MTRVRIAPPDTEEDVSAEQVAAYLRPPGCTCDPLAPTRRRCTSRSLRCAGAMAAHVDPPELPGEEEQEAARLSAVLGNFAATTRPISGALDHDMLGTIALSAQFLDAHAFRLKKARLTAAEPSAVLADIVGPARAASVGVRCDDGPRRCYYARSYRPCTTEDITAAVVAAWPDIAAAVGYVGEDPFPLVDGWMGVGFSVRLFGSGEREGTANQFAARVAMDALMVSLVRAGFAVSHDGNEWQEGRLILGWARPDDNAARGAGESEEP